MIKNKLFSKVFVFSKKNFYNLKKNKLINKKIVLTNNLTFLKKERIDLLVLSNRHIQNAFYLKKLSSKKYSINHFIIEKPFLLGLNEFKKINNIFHKNNKRLSLSTPWFYNYNLKKISKLINNKEITKINFIWNDSLGLKKYGQIRKFDHKIKHSIDIFSHIISILMVILKKTKLLIKDLKYNKINKLEVITFKVFNKSITLKNTRNAKKDNRLINILTSTNNYQINLLTKKIKFNKNQSKIILLKEKKDQLSLQHKLAFSHSQAKIIKDYNIFFSIVYNMDLLLSSINNSKNNL